MSFKICFRQVLWIIQFVAALGVSQSALSSEDVTKQNIPTADDIAQVIAGGDTKAMVQMARLLLDFDVLKTEDAKRLLRIAAEKGDLDAQDDLADCLDMSPCDMDLKEAFEWSLKAARRGRAESQSSVARSYWFGKAGYQDYEKAVYWC